MSTLMKSRLICKTHNFAATVGSAVAFALDYYECPACVVIEDAEYASRNAPCCLAANTTCCGHDDDESGYDPYRPLWVQIDSPNYCDGRPKPRYDEEPPF